MLNKEDKDMEDENSILRLQVNLALDMLINSIVSINNLMTIALWMLVIYLYIALNFTFDLPAFSISFGCLHI